MPMLLTATLTVSSAFKNFGGLNPRPTPTGVPVAMMSPGNNVIVAVKVSINVGMSKIKSAIFAC